MHSGAGEGTEQKERNSTGCGLVSCGKYSKRYLHSRVRGIQRLAAFGIFLPEITRTDILRFPIFHETFSILHFLFYSEQNFLSLVFKYGRRMYVYIRCLMIRDQSTEWDDSTCKNVSKRENRIFLYDASFSRKSNLKIFFRYLWLILSVIKKKKKK